MILAPVQIEGVWLVQPEPISDERGFFARTWCAREFEARGLVSHLVQCNSSFNHKRGTLRGMHFQRHPFAETKIVRCVRGAIFDVVIDLRPDSPTFRHWAAWELTAENRHALYIPEGCAHGFQTLDDDTEVQYQMTVLHHAQAALGVRWNDPAFNIAWPIPISVISPRDQFFPDFNERLLAEAA